MAPQRRTPELGRPLPRAVTLLLLAAGTVAAAATALRDPWRTWALGAALAAFALTALWRLGVVIPRVPKR